MILSTRSAASVFVLVAAASAPAQVVEVWAVPVQTPPGIARVAFDGAGRVATGTTVPDGAGSTDVQVTVLAADGSPAWTRTFATAWAQQFVDVGFAPDGGVVVVATSSDDVLDVPGILVRWDAAGNFEWSAQTQPSYATQHVDVAPNGEVLVCGSAGPLNELDVVLRRYSAAGALLSVTSTVGPPATSDFVFDFVVAADGSSVAVGQSSPSVVSDSIVARFAPDGTPLWRRALDGPGLGYELASSAAFDDAGGVYVGGFRRFPANGAEGYVWKLDAAGNTTWLDSNPEPGSWTLELAVDPRGDVLAVQRGVGAPNETSHLRKLSPSGALLWDRARTQCTVTGLALDGGGDPYVFGQKWNLSGRPFAARYDRDGLERWTVERANGGPASEGAALGHVSGDDALTLVLQGNPPVRIVRWQPTATQFCFGDGSSAACPCGNASPSGNREGCTSTLGVGGRLVDAGAASVSADTLRLHASGVTNTFVTFFQGTSAVAGGFGVAFGDGLRCVGGAQLRIGTRPASENACVYPAGADAPISVQGEVAAPGTRHYQVLFRNSLAFCTPATFNLTSGVSVEWGP